MEQEKTVSRETVFDGHIVKLTVDTVGLPSGKSALREVIEHPGGVAVLPLDSDGGVIAVRQYRYAIKREIVEIPAGKLERGEDHRECAWRELEEETGYSAGEYIYLGNMYPSPGFCDEVIHLYLARDLVPGQAHPEEGEYINVEKIPFDRLIDLIMKNEIRDSKTIMAAFMVRQLLGI